MYKNIAQKLDDIEHEIREMTGSLERDQYAGRKMPFVKDEDLMDALLRIKREVNRAQVEVVLRGHDVGELNWAE